MRSSVKWHRVTFGLVAFGAIALGQSVQAQEAGEDAMQKAVNTRQAVFEVIDFNSQQVMGMLKNKVPFDAAVVQRVASRIEGLAPMIPETFSTDTRKGGVKTKARDGIWTSMPDFKARSDELARAAQALNAAAKSGDKGATIKAIGGVGKACSGCHDNYRDK